MGFNCKLHWEEVYATKKPTDVSWYQAEPALSLEFIISIGLSQRSRIIDVGGGASVLVDRLLDEGFKDLTVLDISSNAINYAKERLGKRAENVTWIETDATEFKPPDKYDFWHDRAVFHFLTDPGDRKKYIQAMDKSLNPGGHVLISTFALDGPPKCSGLDVERYDSDKIENEFGSSFKLIKSIDAVHTTPWNAEQKFASFHFTKWSPTAKAVAPIMTRLRPIAFALGFAGFIRQKLLGGIRRSRTIIFSPSSTGKPRRTLFI